MDTMTKDGLEKVHEIKHGNVVIEIFRKIDERTGKIYFDYMIAREFYAIDGESKRGRRLQQRDLRDNIIACAFCMEWISEQHRANRFSE